MSLKDNTYQNKKFRENLKKFEEAQSLGKSVYLEPEEITQKTLQPFFDNKEEVIKRD